MPQWQPTPAKITVPRNVRGKRYASKRHMKYRCVLCSYNRAVRVKVCWTCYRKLRRLRGAGPYNRDWLQRMIGWALELSPAVRLVLVNALDAGPKHE